MPVSRRAPRESAEQIVAGAAARLSGAPDLAATLQGIAAAARTALGADRATCYVYDIETQVVSAVYTTECDPQRRAFLERAVGLGPAQLPIWRLQLAQSDLVLAVEDTTLDPAVPPSLAARLGSGAFLGVRLEHLSVRAEGASTLLGTLFCSYARPRRFSAVDRQAARGLAGLATLTLANASLQAKTVQSLEESRALAAEQAALRRVATLVAKESEPEAVFAQAAKEAAGLLGVGAAIVVRFTAEGATVIGSYGEHSRLGERLPTVGSGVLARVVRTGAPAGIDDYSTLEPDSPLRAHALAHGYRASVAAPVDVAGRLWGAVLATTRREDGLPADAEARLERFAELVALAIANAEARARLAAQAASDPLTGLANHRAFFERLFIEVERSRRHERPLSLVLIDLDHFKRVNDTRGHLAGDRVLVEVTQRLSALARAEDTLARIGGEEFAWLLPETRAPEAWAAAERARRAIGDSPFPDVGRVTMSAGVAELVAGASVSELFCAADAALYGAKAQGRDVCVPYAPEHEEALAGRLPGTSAGMTSSVERLLALAREQLGLALVAVGQFTRGREVFRYLDGDADVFGMGPGAEIPLEETYCQRVVEGRLPNLIRDARREARVRDLPITQEAGIGAYMGVPITLPGGRLYGMLCCLSPCAEPALGARDVRLLRILAGMLGEELEREERETAVRRGRHERIRRVLESEALSVAFQPIVELASGRVVAAEALICFADEPRRSPEAWFAEAAAVGLGVELELAAIGAALGELGRLPSGARLSLNVSPATLSSGRLDELLATVPAARLFLELSEHAPVDDYAVLEAALAGLRSRGVQLAIDDAGAGFSSLEHILGLRPDVIKLDLALTRDVDTDQVRRALAASLVAFAREIGATIVAEGVETRAELEALQALGVTLGQGHYLARPSPGPVPARVALADRAPAVAAVP
jgi:diguanylate cyclase (GGDEF)-like protein